jgi:hypothetical protein
MYSRAKSCVVAALAFLAYPGQAQIGESPVPPYVACTPTGAGSCNLGFVGFLEGNTVTWWWATIYNNACSDIGGVWGDLTNEYNQYAIDSQLPYTVDILYLSDTGDYNGEFDASK